MEYGEASTVRAQSERFGPVDLSFIDEDVMSDSESGGSPPVDEDGVYELDVTDEDGIYEDESE